ncbi:28S ribosomal protein S22, mitochondrial isoform X1 [Athalia rosae]|uniref:28S ribosomal protein S22, mitochondrial isoform X1 n=1 Tax=Athalia rosae TaxID=37344 RepID=UPI0020332C14|nr:28S ribosomal protein S22, mitochondrial isoform X1 [Athalia rosae]
MVSTGVQVARALRKQIFSSHLGTVLRNGRYNYPLFIKYRSFSSASAEIANERDPAPLFFNEDVQKLLQTLTRVDLKKVYRQRKEGQRMEPPEYKFMTDDELKSALEEAKAKAVIKLQMPPVVKLEDISPSIMSVDHELQGYDESKFVFTDITYGVQSTKRIMVVRDTDGILREADPKERHRLNQIYFPLEGREIDTPKLFDQDYLKDLLSREEYEFILDLACVQFEPNAAEYHEITKSVYDYVNSMKHFEHLRSTRHFGPLAFHLAWSKNIDNLLLENIETSRLDDAVLLVQLYYIVNPTSSSADVKFQGDVLKFIQCYLDTESNMKQKLELAIQSYIDLEHAKREVDKGIKEAQGLD